MYKSDTDIRRFSLATFAFILFLCAGLPAIAQDTGWSIGLGLTGSAATSEGDGVQDIDFGGITLFGRWQHQSSGWGAMAELRGGEDDESFTELEYGQLNLYATYTWRRNKLLRPFIKFGISGTEVERVGGVSEDDSSGILGGGFEVGRGHWTFHYSIDGTETEIDLIDPRERTSFGSSTIGATFRF
ncbi:MAG: porin family protein [bacterium]|nr:porin family protein [bacterium]